MGGFVLIFSLFFFFVPMGEDTVQRQGAFAFKIALSSLALATTVGLQFRFGWGRIVGFIFCAYLLILFPIGTLIGIFGIVALVGSEPLFGKDGWRAQELKKEYKQRKKALRAR